MLVCDHEGLLVVENCNLSFWCEHALEYELYSPEGMLREVYSSWHLGILHHMTVMPAVGACVIHRDPKRGGERIVSTYVKPRFRRQGYGRKLLARTLTERTEEERRGLRYYGGAEHLTKFYPRFFQEHMDLWTAS